MCPQCFQFLPGYVCVNNYYISTCTKLKSQVFKSIIIIIKILGAHDDRKWWTANGHTVN